MDMRTIETETGKHKEAFELFASAKTGFKTLRSLYESTLRSLVSEASSFASLNLSKPGRFAYMTHLSKRSLSRQSRSSAVSHEWREDKQNLEADLLPRSRRGYRIQPRVSTLAFKPSPFKAVRPGGAGKICLDQSHTYRSSNYGSPCLFSSARNSS